MAQPFIGEIRIMGFTYAPRGWALCTGQLLQIQQHSALFAVIGITFGGNGSTNFALPNFQGIAPMGWGNGPGLTPRVIGETTGEPSVTLTVQQMPAHIHVAVGKAPTSAATQLVAAPANDAGLGTALPARLFAAPPATTNFAPTMIGQSGNSQPHNNIQPLLTLNFCMALEGIFPSRN